jgi:hypothetical protein
MAKRTNQERSTPRAGARLNLALAALILGLAGAAVAAPVAEAGAKTGIVILPPRPVFGPSPGFVPPPTAVPPGVAPFPVPPLPPRVTYFTPPLVVPFVIHRHGGHHVHPHH